MITAGVILFAVFIDAQRMILLKKLEQRNIRVEKGADRIKVVSQAANPTS
jgi:hypothetical protein